MYSLSNKSEYCYIHQHFIQSLAPQRALVSKNLDRNQLGYEQSIYFFLIL